MADHQLRLASEAAAMAGEGQHQQHQQQQRSDGGSVSGGAGGSQGGGDNVNRPTFVEYWKGEKESERAGRVQFVNEGQPSSSSMSPPPQPQLQGQEGLSDSTTGADKSKERAKLRRQQVRKAQIQHRTRKANYIKQLELDVCKFRDMIAAVEKEMMAYRQQNEGMRGALRARGLRLPEELKGKEKEVLVSEVQIAEHPSEEEVPSHLGEIQQSVEAHQQHQQAYIPEQQEQQLQGHMDAQIDYQHQQHMSPSEQLLVHEQEELEYDPYPPVDLFADINMGEITVTMSKDNALSSPCIQISAPSSVNISPAPRPTSPDQLSPGQEIIAINLILAMEHICWNHFHPRQYPGHGDPCKAASGHTMMASTMCMSSAPDRVYRSIRRGDASTTTHAWQASTGAGSSLSLKSLLSLARALNPGDIELTPVQAWFELAARYGTAALLEDRVVEALKREFCGVVDCIHFGAIIERDAFESVAARVMAEVGVPEIGYEMDVDVDLGGAPGPGMMAGAQQIAA